MKTLLKFILALSLIGCSAPLEKPSTDSFVEEEEEVSWENCAQEVGSHPCDFTLRDQHDNEVSLYDFYGSIARVKQQDLMLKQQQIDSPRTM